MKSANHIDFDSRATAGRALLFSGIVGALVGVKTGLACGVFSLVVEAPPGAIWRVPTGFCAGVV